VHSITKAGRAEQTINKSRFIAVAEHADSERAAMNCIVHLANAYRDASHIAFAFRLKTPQGIVQRFNDAGEPSGTAGKPVLQYLEGRDLINVCVAVVRYYGGINLGTGGLARAYGGTARQAIAAAQVVPYVEMGQLKMRLDYASFDAFTRELTRVHGEIIEKHFGEAIDVVIRLPASEIEILKQRFAR